MSVYAPGISVNALSECKVQWGASQMSSVHCILVYTPPYLSCQEGGGGFFLQ